MAHSDLAIKIEIYIYNPCGYTMKISSSYHRLLIYDVK